MRSASRPHARIVARATASPPGSSSAHRGSRLALRPGLWVAIDDSQQIDFNNVLLDDVGGKVGLLQNAEPLDVNYLVLAMEMDSDSLDPRGVVPKG